MTTAMAFATPFIPTCMPILRRSARTNPAVAPRCAHRMIRNTRSRGLSITMGSETPPTSDDEKDAPASSSATAGESAAENVESAVPSDDEDESTRSAAPRKKYSMRTRLREETEAPFRKARMFVYAGSAISASVGAFISSLRILAALIGTSGVQPLNETIPNLGIDVTVIALCAFLLQRENKAGERRLERMSRGARIARLRVQDAATRQTIQLKELRGRKRVMVVAGSAFSLASVLQDAQPFKRDIEASSLVVVPCIIPARGRGSDGDASEGVESIARGWKFLPYVTEEWGTWLDSERDVMKSRLKGRDDVIVIVIRLDGKVGARSVGAPVWQRLLDEVAKLPPNDKYGKP